MFLNCHSYHSLRYGTIPLDDLVDMAENQGLDFLGLTDINTVTGVYDFVKRCRTRKIKPIVGIEFRNGNRLLYTGLAENVRGLGELCVFLTEHNLDKRVLPRKAPSFENAIMVYPLSNLPQNMGIKEFMGVRSTDITKLIRPEFKTLLPKAIIFQSVVVRNRAELELHRILRCIDHNILLSQLPMEAHCDGSERFYPVGTILRSFEQYPQIVENTKEVIGRCNFDFDFNVARNKKFYTGSKSGDMLLLRQLAYDGLTVRYGKNHREAKARIEKELKVIGDLNFTGYFLITWDIVRYSQSRGFMHVGRGSGANSIVSYCLGITDICPIELDLYFERFLNESRKSPPDFDIDWSWRERDEILDYIFKRFDPGHVAFCGTIVEFKHRS